MTLCGGSFFSDLFVLICLCLGIYAASARLHDLGYPGWIARIWLLLNILPYSEELFGIIIRILCLCLGIVLLFVKGKENDNEYGLNPYKNEGQQEIEQNEKNIKDDNEKDLVDQKEGLKIKKEKK